MSATILPMRPSLARHISLQGDENSVVSTTATDCVPPLTPASSSLSSLDSLSSEKASILGRYLLESHDGNLIVPSRFQANADLLCPFQILDCDEVFADIVHFKMHVFSHFKGHELPTSAACFLCERKFCQGQTDDSAYAWNKMLSHMVHDHFRQGQQLATVRPNFSLMRWMYSRRIISDHHFKRTQMQPIPTLLPGPSQQRSESAPLPMAPMAPSAALSSTLLSQLPPAAGVRWEVYTLSAGPRSERRRRDATRTILRPRGGH